MEKIFIRTVTMYYVGCLKEETPEEYVLVGDGDKGRAAWIADTGPFSEMLHKGFGGSAEIEVYPAEVEVKVRKSATVDNCTWLHALPEQKQ